MRQLEVRLNAKDVHVIKSVPAENVDSAGCAEHQKNKPEIESADIEHDEDLFSWDDERIEVDPGVDGCRQVLAVIAE
jgi:hypothetical protein